MSANSIRGLGGSPKHMRELTENERDWVEFLRLIANGRDPALSLKGVQLLRRIMQRKSRFPG